MTELLTVENLSTHFITQDGIVKAVDGISFSLGAGQVLGLVGESGSGKSMTCRSIIRLVPAPGKIVDGKIYYQGENLLAWPENHMRQIRGREISMIMQEPMTALNPVLSIGEQIVETIIGHENTTKVEARKRSAELLKLVGIPSPESRLDEYPHQFSGGMRQRAMIGIALACKPKVLLADEPTTALDVTIQDQIIRLILDLQVEFGLSVLWVTHDLGVVAQICDQVVVMYAGQIMEITNVIDLFENSRHPYTCGLIESIPNGSAREGKLISIPGQTPNLLTLPEGCPFEPRCRFSVNDCSKGKISLKLVSPGHFSACIRIDQLWN